jgi:dTDP-4-amino-4,6-dideoxygalactose transaminase
VRIEARCKRRLATTGSRQSVHYPPIHTFSAYRETTRRELPRTDTVAGRLLTLPLYGRMTDTQVDAVIEALLRTLFG